MVRMIPFFQSAQHHCRGNLYLSKKKFYFSYSTTYGCPESPVHKSFQYALESTSTNEFPNENKSDGLPLQLPESSTPSRGHRLPFDRSCQARVRIQLEFYHGPNASRSR